MRFGVLAGDELIDPPDPKEMTVVMFQSLGEHYKSMDSTYLGKHVIYALGKEWNSYLEKKF